MTDQEQKDHVLKVKIEIYKQFEKELIQKREAIQDYAAHIVETHCPYKVGDQVVYTEWWRPNFKQKGSVYNVQLDVDEDSIDGLWKITVWPTTKEGAKHKGKNPVRLGRDNRETIKHIEVKS